MKNALKCEFELLVLAKNWEIGTVFGEKFLIFKKPILGPFSVYSPLAIKEDLSKYSQNFDMGFQKRSLNRIFSRYCYCPITVPLLFLSLITVTFLSLTFYHRTTPYKKWLKTVRMINGDGRDEVLPWFTLTWKIVMGW